MAQTNFVESPWCAGFADRYQLVSLSGVRGGADAGPVSLGVVHEPSSPLLVGVAQLTEGHGGRNTGPLLHDAISVVDWATGEPLVVRGSFGSRRRCDLNMVVYSNDAVPGFWIGDGANLIRNALVYR